MDRDRAAVVVWLFDFQQSPNEIANVAAVNSPLEFLHRVVVKVAMKLFRKPETHLERRVFEFNCNLGRRAL